MVPKGITILIAEDEPQIRDLLTMIFEGEGYAVLVANDGEEALQIARKYAGQIDLLVSNVQMPGMSGPELANELWRSRPELRVLLISGYLHGTLALGEHWQFLKKPFMPREILAKVDELMGKPSEPRRMDEE